MLKLVDFKKVKISAIEQLKGGAQATQGGRLSVDLPVIGCTSGSYSSDHAWDDGTLSYCDWKSDGGNITVGEINP